MSRKAKSLCPGCKLNKSDHDFGKPSAKCTGPTTNDSNMFYEDPETLELTKEIKELTLKHNSLLRLKKQQLLAATQVLTTDLETGLKQQSELPDTASTSSNSSTKQADTPRTTIKDLRKKVELVKSADESFKDWLQDSDSSDDDVDATSRQQGKKRSASKKPKSGSERIGQDDIKAPIKWPHLAILNVDGTEKLRFSDLNVHKLVAGELEIILELLETSNSNSTDVTSNESHELKGRLQRLKDTMYYSVLYDFVSAREYFRQVGLLIERGKNDWNGSFDHLVKWLFRPNTNANNSETPISSFRNKPNYPAKPTQSDDTLDFICRMFNYKDKCKFDSARGKCNRAHICLNCFKLGITADHRALDCKSRDK